jgi:hypothetical protein
MEWKWFGLFSFQKKICAISLSFVGPQGPNFFPKEKWGWDCSAITSQGWHLWEIVCNKRPGPILDMEGAIVVKCELEAKKLL